MCRTRPLLLQSNVRLQRTAAPALLVSRRFQHSDAAEEQTSATIQTEADKWYGEDKMLSPDARPPRRNPVRRPLPPAGPRTPRQGPKRLDLKPSFEEEFGHIFDDDVNAIVNEEEAAKLIEQMTKKAKGEPITNHDILFKVINFIDMNGRFHPNVPLQTVLSKLELEQDVLVLVNPKKQICKVTKKWKLEDRLKKVKEVSISWNVEESDLAYRLQKAVGWLKAGYRLNLMIGVKNPKLMRDARDRKVFLKRIRETLGTEGLEYQSPTGTFPVMEMYWRGYTPVEKMLAHPAAAAANGDGSNDTKPIEEPLKKKEWEDDDEIEELKAKEKAEKAIAKKLLREEKKKEISRQPAKKPPTAPKLEELDLKPVEQQPLSTQSTVLDQIRQFSKVAPSSSLLGGLKNFR